MNESEIENLLRKTHDQETPRPGLEQRIQANLPKKRGGFPVFLVGALAALVVGVSFALISQKPGRNESDVVVKKPETRIEAVAPIQLSLKNPLEEETEALQATAKKTASFLLSRFPSLPDEETS